VTRYHFIPGAVLFALTVSPLQAQTRIFPDTRDGIHVFSDQLQNGMSEAQYSFAANSLTGCQKMLLDDVRNLRQYNPDFIVLHYQLGCGNGPQPFIDGNEWTSDWSYVSGRESWFMHQGASRLYMAQWDWYLMDISNINYQNYWVNSCMDRMKDTECDGVFADSFTADAYFNQLTPEHPWFTDTGLCLGHWIPRLEAYADYIGGLFASSPERYYFLPNLGALVTSWDTTDYSGLGDGGMVEGFSLWGNGSYFDLSDWNLQMNRILTLVRNDRIIICQSYTSDTSLRERMFLTGCYLLIKGDRTYFNMLEEGDTELVYYPEYDIGIGSYEGEIASTIDELYDESSGCYRREYSNGLVLVNPGETDINTGDLGGTYLLVSAIGGGPVDESGNHGGSLSYREVNGTNVPAHGASILLNHIPSSKHSVTLWTDKESFSRAETLTLHWIINPGGTATRNTVDAYVAATTPRGNLYFYDGSFTEQPSPIASSMVVNSGEGNLGPFSLEGLPGGAYTWYAVLVAPGGNPLQSSNWLSNLAISPFSLF
jgi:hypothetical protein